MYNILGIGDSIIITNKGEINMYEIKPCTVLGESDELKQNIYNAYIAALKMITFNYKIVIKTGKLDFYEILNILNQNIYSTYNMAQKKIIEEYKRYLLDLSKSIQLFTKTFYIVTDKLTVQEETQLIEAFRLVKHLGINIEKITDERILYDILYESINKISKGVEANEY